MSNTEEGNPLPKVSSAPLIVDVEFTEIEDDEVEKNNTSDSIQSSSIYSPMELPNSLPSPKNRARVVTVTNQKGGVGKTTVAVNLAAALSINYKLNCVLIDAAPIGSSSLWIEETSVQRLKLKRLTLPNSPGNKYHALQTWGATLSSIALEYDIVIADLPPIDLGVFSELIHQVGFVIIPVGLSSLEWEASF